MQEDRVRCIISEIKRFELAPAEKDFIAFAEQNINRCGPLMKDIELILEGIYWHKTRFIRNSIVSMLKKEQNPLDPLNHGSKFRLSLGRF